MKLAPTAALVVRSPPETIISREKGGRNSKAGNREVDAVLNYVCALQLLGGRVDTATQSQELLTSDRLPWKSVPAIQMYLTR